MKNLTSFKRLSFGFIASCIFPVAFAEDIKSDSSDFSIRNLQKAVIIISPDKTTLPIFFSPEGNPAVSIPASFPYVILIQQRPNPDSITSVTIMDPKKKLIDVITVDFTQKADFAPKQIIDEMRETLSEQK